MESINPSELPHSFSILPGYPYTCTGRKIWLIFVSQLFVCIVSSICLSYVFYQKFYVNRKKSWKRAVEIMEPIKKRLQNLEKERIIWKSYLEWIEDYCSVYFGLLNYLNATAADLGKLYKDQSRTLRNFGDCSDQTIQSDFGSKPEDNQYDEKHRSEFSWDGLASDEDVQLIANFASVFANLKLQEIARPGNEDAVVESSSTASLDLGSINEINEESVLDDAEFNEDNKFVEHLEMLFLKKKKHDHRATSTHSNAQKLQLLEEY